MLARWLKGGLPKPGFARNVATLSGATALAQLIAFCTLPIITRLYGPEAFGAAGAFAGIVAMIGVVGALRYELALSLPHRDRAAWHVAVLALTILTAVVVVTWIGASWVLTWAWDDTGLPRWVFAALLAFGVGSLGAYQVASFWAVRKSNFGALARTRIQQGITGPASQIAFGFAGFGALGLILGQILSQSGGLIRLALSMIADNQRTGISIHRRGLAWAAKRYRRFPIYDSTASLLNMAGAQAPVILFAALFSPALAGYYALAQRVLSAPMGLIGKAVSQVLLPRVVKSGRSEEGRRLVLRLVEILSWLSFFPFTMVTLFSAKIVPVLFGHEWTPAATLLAWTALWVAWQFVTSPLSMVMVGLEAVRRHMAVQLVLFVLRIVPIPLGAFLGSADIAVIGVSVASVVGYIIYLLAICSVVGLTVWSIVTALAGPIAFSLTCAVLVLELSQYFSAGYVVLLVSTGVWLWRVRILVLENLMK
jgi:O-antigen/teichoic acid export membrane protein